MAKLSFGQKLANTLQDTVELVTGQRDEMMPPRTLLFGEAYDPEAFRAEGEAYLGYFQDLCDLQPDERVLDVGCGPGQKAIPLSEYLNEDGRYYGFDINASVIKWCEKQIAAQHENFFFRQDKLLHPIYNPKGKYKIIDHYFAYEPKDFHFGFMVNLLPYLTFDESAWYITELGRVIKKRGRALMSLYLLNEDSRSALAEGRSRYPFTVPQGDSGLHLSVSAEQPRLRMAFDEAAILQAIEDSDLKLEEIHYGSWSGRADHLAEQDIITLSKP